MRTLEIETPELVAEPLKQLPHPVARQKLRALAAGTHMVRRDLGV